MKSLFSVVLISIAVLGNASARDAKVLMEKDNFSGLTTYFTPPERPALQGGSFWSERYVTLSLQGFSGHPQDYTLKVDALLPEWIFLKSSGDGMDLKIDGQIEPIFGMGSADNRNVISGDTVEEVALYRITPEVLRRIIAAESVQFRLYGDKGVITGAFTPQIVSDMKLFSAKAPELLGQQLGTSNVAMSPASNAPSGPAIPQRFGATFAAYPGGHGVIIFSVTAGLPASNAGIKPGDVVTSFDGKLIDSTSALQAAVASHPAGSAATVTVARPDSGSRELNVSM